MQWIGKRNTNSSGKEAEDKACRHLEENGLILLERNYHCRRGEVDLIMQDGSEIVFVEVKYRRNSFHGGAVEYFHAQKRKKFEYAVQHYLHNKRLNPVQVAHRIDLVAIDNQKIMWLKSV